MDIIKSIADKRLKPRHEEDFVDRANYVTTPFVLSMAAVFCFAKEYGPWSQPLYCWTNAEWNDQWLEYAHDYCFIESTYYVPMNESIPLRGQRNNADDQVNYYQWLPFILFLMALICQMPHHFWRLCNSISGKNLPTIIRQAHDAVGRNNEQKVAAGIARHLYTALSGRERGEQHEGWRIYRAYKWFTNQICRHMLCFFYLLMKVFFLVANIGQLFFITYFLGAIGTPKWGLQILDSFIQYGTAWEQSGLFPRISLCDFKIRMPGQNNNNNLNLTVQCVLMANFLNEKIFLALYYLFAFMSMLTLLNLVWWFWLLFRPASGYVRKMVELSAMPLHPDPEMPKHFGPPEEMLAAIEWSAAAADLSSSSSSGGGGGGADSAQMTISQTSSSTLPPSSYRHGQVSPTSSNATTNTFVSASRGGENILPIEMDGRLEEGIVNFEGLQTRRQRGDQRGERPNEAVIPHDAMESVTSEWRWRVLETQEKRMQFCWDYCKLKGEFLQMLGSDGILVFNLIRVNAGSQMASQIMGELFKIFEESKSAEKMGKNLSPA